VYSYQPTDENGNDDPFAFLKSSLLKSDDGNGDGMSDLEGSSADCGIGPRIVSSVGDDVRSVHHVHHHHHLYNDDSDSDNMDGAGGGEYAPTTTGQVLWTFNYFFVNKHTKRILLFTCIETMMRSTTGFVTAEEEHDDNSSTPRKAAGDTTLLGRRQHHPDTIPEHDAVHHDGTLLASTFVSGSTHGSSSSSGHRHRRSASLTSLSSQNDNDDDSDAGFNDNDTTASSAVSVDDFDLDPSHSVSGGIPIGTA
jgi:hypothetical protein